MVFNSIEAKNKGIYPYYLDSSLTEKSLCPIAISFCNTKGNILYSHFVSRETRISFLDFINSITNHKLVKIWFHFLRYDATIIMHELFYNGFTQIFESETMVYKGIYSTLKTDKSFSIIGENLSSFVGINIYYNDKTIQLRDTFKVIPTSQNKILEAFGYNKKVDVKWDTINIDNLYQNKNLIMERNIYDIVSLAQSFELYKKTLYDNFEAKGITAASLSLSAYKSYLKKEHYIHDYKYIYPQLSENAKEISDGCYNGGLVLINKRHINKIHKNVGMLDRTSAYSKAMTEKLPFGLPKEIHDFNVNKETYNEYLIKIKFKINGIPFQRCHSEKQADKILNNPIKAKYHKRSHLPEIFEGCIMLNSIDLNLLQNYADIEYIKFIKGYSYQTTLILGDFIKNLFKLKVNATGALRLGAKLLQNSLYGKFAQDLSGNVKNYESMLKYENVIAIDTNYYYKPLSSAVTSYCRAELTKVTYLLKDDFLYADTDSVYFLNPENNYAMLDKLGYISDTELGKWKKEHKNIITRAKFLSKKNYMLEDDGKISLTCVGLPPKYRHYFNFDNFHLNSETIKITKLGLIYGGLAEKETEFTMKARDV